MQNLNPYLTFNGNCREAMTFYHGVLGGDIFMQTFGDSPMEVSDKEKDQVMHSSITSGSIVIMASDSMPDHPVKIGGNVSLSINCTSREEVEKLYNALTLGGQATMPLQDTFWGAYFGMLTDKFGVQWMFNYDMPKS